MHHGACKLPGIFAIPILFILSENWNESSGYDTKNQQIIKQIRYSEGCVISIQIINTRPSRSPECLS